MKFGADLDATDSMYPTQSAVRTTQTGKKTFGASLLMAPIGASVYGYAEQGGIDCESGWIKRGSAFAMTHDEWNAAVVLGGSIIWAVVRLGYRVPFTVTKPEAKGRLSYIDGCTDSMLVYPARKGDGSLNLLQFPPGINQSWHTHPSIRMGYVLSGEGVACFGDDEEQVLEAGKSFMLPEHGRHRFVTNDKEMRIIAYHPDGDWGPEDGNHPMLNRTYLSGK